MELHDGEICAEALNVGLRRAHQKGKIDWCRKKDGVFKSTSFSLDDTKKKSILTLAVLYTLEIFRESSKVACHSLISFSLESNKKRKSE